MCLVGVHIFNLFAPSNATGSLSACYVKHESTWTRGPTD